MYGIHLHNNCQRVRAVQQQKTVAVLAAQNRDMRERARK